MKILILLFPFLFPLAAKAYQAVDLSPLQLQFRFEDTSAQSRENLNYQSMSTAFQKDFFRIGFGYARHSDDTGNASLRIENEKKEYLANFGFQTCSVQGENNNLRLDFFAEGLLGITQSKVSTTLLGLTTSSTSNYNTVYGLGAAAIGRYGYFLLEADIQVLGSKSFSPQYVPVVTIKAGISIPIP